MTSRGQRCSGVTVRLIFGAHAGSTVTCIHGMEVSLPGPWPSSLPHALPVQGGVSLFALQQEVDLAQVAFLDTCK